MAGQLARARAMLAKRLTRNGPEMSGMTVAGMLTQKTASVGVPTELMFRTTRAVAMVATGQAAGGLIPPKVLSLVEGVMRAMLLKKLKIGAFVLLMALAAAGVGGLAARGLAGGVPQGPSRAAYPETNRALPSSLPRDSKGNRTNQGAAPDLLLSGPPRLRIEHKGSVLRAAWSSDSKRVATSTKSSGIHITDATSGREKQSFLPGDAFGAFAFSPDGKALLVALDGSVDAPPGPVVSIWDIGTGKEQRQIGGSWCPAAVECLACTGGGNVIVGVGVGGCYEWGRNRA